MLGRWRHWGGNIVCFFYGWVCIFHFFYETSNSSTILPIYFILNTLRYTTNIISILAIIKYPFICLTVHVVPKMTLKTWGGYFQYSIFQFNRMSLLVQVPSINFRISCIVYASVYEVVGVIFNSYFPVWDTNFWIVFPIGWYSFETSGITLYLANQEEHFLSLIKYHCKYINPKVL